MSGLITFEGLVGLSPADLAELLNNTGEPTIERAAEALDIDLYDLPTYEAVCALLGLDTLSNVPTPVVPGSAIGGQVTPDPNVSAAHEGVRSDLTPDPRAVPAPDDDQGGDVDALSEPLSAEDVAALLAEYRGKMVPFLAGTFAMYSAANGDVVIVTERPEAGVQNATIPAKLIRLALGMMSGRGSMLRRLMRG